MLPIVTLPLFTRYLTPADYGVLAIFNIVTMFAGNFFRLEINSALKREYVDGFSTFSRYVSTAFIFSHFLLLLCALVLLLLMPWLHAFHGIGVQWYFVVLLLAYLRFHTVCLHHLFQLSNRAVLFGAWGLVATLGTFGLAIWSMIFLGWGWQARAWAEVLVAVVAFPVAIYFLRRDYALKWYFDIATLKKMLRFSSPLLLTSMLGYVLISADRLFIAGMVGPQELGLYTVALQLSSAMGMFLGAVVPTWESWIYTSQGGVHRSNAKKVLSRFFALITVLFVFAVVLPTLLNLVLPYITDKSFSGVEAYLAPTVAAAASAGVFGLLSPILIFMRKTPVVASINVLMVLMNFGFLYVFIGVWGAVGAAYAMALSYVIGSTLMLFFVIRFSDAKFEDIFTVR
jgi:O-antigen/teichoic acid export membrane protein